MYDVFVKKEQTELKKTLKEKLRSPKRSVLSCFIVHDPECRRISVMEHRAFTENLSDIMLIARSRSICLFN